MLTENKACLLKEKREKKKIEFLSSNKTTYSLHTRTMLCICWLHFSRSRIKSSYLFSPLSGTWFSVSSGSHTHTCGPAALGQRPPLLASLSPSPGRKGCSLWFHGVCFPCTHTVLSWSPEQMDSRNKKAKSTEAKQTSKESRGKTEHWKKLNRPADRGAQKVFMIVEKLHSDSYVSGGDPWVKRVRKTGSPLWSILTEGQGNTKSIYYPPRSFQWVRIWLDLERENQTSLLNKIHAEETNFGF